MKQRILLLTLSLLAFAFVAPAQTLWMFGDGNLHSVEVVGLNAKTRAVYQANELMFIETAASHVWTVKETETGSQLWTGKRDSVYVIAQADTTQQSTDTQLKALLLTSCLKAHTANGAQYVYIGKSNITYSYVQSTGRLDIKYGRNKQPLWFGAVDLFDSATGATVADKLAYIRNTLGATTLSQILTGGTASTIAAGAGAGTTPTLTTVKDATSAKVTLTVGSSPPTTGVLFTVTPPVKPPTGFKITLTPANSIAAQHIARVWVQDDGAGVFTARVAGTALTAATEYIWYLTWTSY